MTADQRPGIFPEPSPFEYLVKNPNVQVFSFTGRKIGESFPGSDPRIADLSTDPMVELAFCRGLRHTYSFSEDDPRVKSWQEWQKTLLYPMKFDIAQRFGFRFRNLVVLPSASEFAEAYRNGLEAPRDISKRRPGLSLITSTELDESTVVTFRADGSGFRILGKDQLDDTVYALPAFRLPT